MPDKKYDCGFDIENQNIKPNFIKSRIHEILESKSIIHVIEESDKND